MKKRSTRRGAPFFARSPAWQRCWGCAPTGRGDFAARKGCFCPCTVQGASQRGHSLSQKRMAPLEPQEKGFALADWHLKSCAACGIRCLPGVVSKRLGLLLSSLSLCLRFGSLTQFPPTLDLYRFAIACRGGFAGARRSTHYQDDMHCQMIRLHQNKMSRAAADDRSRPNRIAMLTRLRRAQGSAIGKHRTSSSCSLAMKIFSGRV